MASESEPQAKALFGIMVDFARFCANGHGNNFCLEGPVNVPTNFDTFVGIFPNELNEALAAVGQRQLDYGEVYGKILQLEIPDRVKKLEVEPDLAVRTVQERLLSQYGMPTIVIGLGETRDAKQESAYLFTVMGITPAAALNELKRRINERL